MNQQRLMWGITFVLFLGLVRMEFPALCQTLPPAPENSDLVEAKKLNQQAIKLYNHGKYAEAEPLYRRSLAIRERALGKEHPDVATSLNNLAFLYAGQGKYTEAEPLYQRALDIREKALGKEHPDVANSLNNLAVLYSSQRRYAQAVEFFDQASVIEGKNLSQILLIGSELDKKNYVDNISTSPDFSIDLTIKSNRMDADRLALTNVLRRQGHVLDATAATIQSIRPRLKDRPDLQQLFDDWKTTLQEQSALINSQLSKKNLKSIKPDIRN